jgi:hypothetical protein
MAVGLSSSRNRSSSHIQKSHEAPEVMMAIKESLLLLRFTILLFPPGTYL